MKTESPKLVFTAAIVNGKMTRFQADPDFAPGLELVTEPLEDALNRQIDRNDAQLAENATVLSEYDILNAAADESEWKGFNAYMRCMETEGVRAQDLDEEMGRYEFEHRASW